MAPNPSDYLSVQFYAEKMCQKFKGEDDAEAACSAIGLASSSGSGNTKTSAGGVTVGSGTATLGGTTTGKAATGTTATGTAGTGTAATGTAATGTQQTQTPSSAAAVTAFASREMLIGLAMLAVNI